MVQPTAHAVGYFLAPLTGLNANPMSKVTLSNYRVLFDRQHKGYRASVATAALKGSRLQLVFMYASDGKRGLPQHTSFSDDLGKTWSSPTLFGPPMSNPDLQHQGVMLVGYTHSGTLIVSGFFAERGIRTDDENEQYFEDVAWRPTDVIIGRQESGQAEISFTKIPTGTFLGEQFAERGTVLESGRIMLPIWGSKNRGDNWGCGVLLSDDDGRTWRFRRVGLESDLKIRKQPKVPAGYNEQTFFELPVQPPAPPGDTSNARSTSQTNASRTRLISIIRGREHLGAIDDQLDETWFFRSVSDDGGETWSKPEPTNLAGTGATPVGLVFPDGSLLQACRIPHRAAATVGLTLPDPAAMPYGLHFARSRDEGRTWTTDHLVQRDPSGRVFDNYYNVMNGQFVQLAETKWMYTFGHFEYVADRHRVLSIDVEWKS